MCTIQRRGKVVQEEGGIYKIYKYYYLQLKAIIMLVLWSMHQARMNEGKQQVGPYLYLCGYRVSPPRLPRQRRFLTHKIVEGRGIPSLPLIQSAGPLIYPHAAIYNKAHLFTRGTKNRSSVFRFFVWRFNQMPINFF